MAQHPQQPAGLPPAAAQQARAIGAQMRAQGVRYEGERSKPDPPPHTPRPEPSGSTGRAARGYGAPSYDGMRKKRRGRGR